MAPLGKLAYILGGGASASEAIDEIPRLREKAYVLGVNRAVQAVSCDGVVAVDRSFLSVDAELWKGYGQEAHGVFADKGQEPSWATLWTRKDGTMPTRELGAIGTGHKGACNAGLVAIHVMAQLMVNQETWPQPGTIICLGFDFDEGNVSWLPKANSRSGGMTAYKDEENLGKPRPKREEILKNFAACAPFWQAWGMRVILANPQTAIQGYETMGLKEAMDFKEG